MAAIEQRVNSRKGRDRRRKAGSSRYGQRTPEPSGWSSSKTFKLWKRILVLLGFWDQVGKCA
jgi:hypothetical protein